MFRPFRSASDKKIKQQTVQRYDFLQNGHRPAEEYSHRPGRLRSGSDQRAILPDELHIPLFVINRPLRSIAERSDELRTEIVSNRAISGERLCKRMEISSRLLIGRRSRFQCSQHRENTKMRRRKGEGFFSPIHIHISLLIRIIGLTCNHTD